MSSAEPAFCVTFGCENCENEWDTEFPARTKVFRANDVDVRTANQDCEKLGMCECCGLVQCPVCKLYSDVTIEGRTPVTSNE